jgi:hypothetical protein
MCAPLAAMAAANLAIGVASSPDVFRDEALIRFLLRGSRRMVDQWQRRFSLLWTIVGAENTIHCRWLRFLGFDFIEKGAANRREFYTAAKRGHCATP